MGRPLNKRFLGINGSRKIRVGHFRRASGPEMTGSNNICVMSQRSRNRFIITDTIGGWTETLRLVDKPAGSLLPGEFRVSAINESGQTINVRQFNNRKLKVSGSISGPWSIDFNTISFGGAAAIIVPNIITIPVITGIKQEGQTLTVNTGSWTNSPTSYAYTWRRNGSAINLATTNTYLLTQADVGATISVQVIASNVGGPSFPAVSAETQEVSSAGVLTLFDQIIGLRNGSTANGRTTTATPFMPTSTNLPVGMTWSVDGAGRPTITTNASFTGNIVNWNGSGMRLRVQGRRIPLIEQCIWAQVTIDEAAGGIVDVMRYCTIDGQGWNGFRDEALVGAALLTERNRFIGTYQDGINFGPGTTDPAGITFQWNYSRPGPNLPYDPLPWNPTTSYVCNPPSNIDFVRDASGQVWIARTASLNQPLPTSGVSNTWWAMWASSTRPSSVLPILYPHADAMVLKGSDGGGYLIENNLIDWTRDTDGLLGFGPTIGQGTNQGVRYDPGNSSTTAKRLAPIVIRSNILERNSLQGSNNPFDIAHRSLPDNNGLVSILDNWIAPNVNGRYSSSNQAVDVWSGNLDLRTLNSIPAPNGVMRGAPNYGTNKPIVTAGTGTYPLLTVNFPAVDGGALNNISYQWRRNGSNIGTNSRTYQTVNPADVGANISVVLTGTNGAGSTVSVPSDNFLIATPFIVFTTPPVLSGEARVGETITWTLGTYSAATTSIVSRVYADGAIIAGIPTSATSYTLTAEEEGKEVYVEVTITSANNTTASAITDTTELVEPVAFFAFELLSADGSTTITSVPNLRVSLNGGAWQTLSDAGLTVSRSSDGAGLEVTGFADATARDTARFTYEQEIPGEPSSARVTLANNLPAIYFRRVSGPAPWNTSIPGMTVSASRANGPIGVS